MREFTFHSKTPATTLKLGKKLGSKLFPGTIIALKGDLGCGKTVLTRGICTGLGVPERTVNSPTFAFVNEYQGCLPVFHIDLYRLNNAMESIEIGILDYFNRGKSGVTVIEWAEKITALLPEEYLQIEFQGTGKQIRELKFTAHGQRFETLLGELFK